MSHPIVYDARWTDLGKNTGLAARASDVGTSANVRREVRGGESVLIEAEVEVAGRSSGYTRCPNL